MWEVERFYLLFISLHLSVSIEGCYEPTTSNSVISWSAGSSSPGGQTTPGGC
jgi:hypothetical protein